MPQPSEPPADPAPADPVPSPQSSPFDGLTKVATVLGQFVAPTTLLTAVLFYFGWNHTYRFFEYFGVNSTSLHPSIREYLMRSVDALFVPLIVAGVVGMALMWGYIALPESVRRGRHPRWHTITMTVVAVALVFNGVSRIYVVTPLNSGLCVAPLSIIVGVGVLGYVVVVRRRRLRELHPDTPPRTEAATFMEWATIFVLVGITLFWIATDYSVAVGQTRARETAAEIPSRPRVVVYSEKDLHLSTSDVRVVECRSPDPAAGSAYRFRYDGLVLLTQIGDQYVLLPTTWQYRHGAAIVLPTSSPGNIRFEYRLPGDRATDTC